MAKLLSGTRIYGNLVVDTWANAASANISGTTTSTSTTTGALIVTGGAGIAGNLNVGGNVVITGNLSITGNLTSVNYETVTNTEYVTALVATTVNAATIGNASATFSGSSATLTGTVIAATVNAATIGNSGATLTGTLSTASQPNVTTLAGLTSFGTAGTTTVSQGNLTITGNLTVNGNSVSIGASTLSIVDPIISLNTPADLSPLTTTTTADIGLKLHYYDTSDQHAFLGRAVDTGYLEWYARGNDTANVFTGTVYGTVKTGGLWLANTTSSTSKTTGALRVDGGVGVAGDVNIGGNVNINVASGLPVLAANDTSATGTGGVVFLGGGTGSPVLQLGRNVGGSGNIYFNFSGSMPTMSYLGSGSYMTTAYTGKYYTIVGGNTPGTNDYLQVWQANGNVVITSTTSSTSTTTGALTVAGGAGIGGNLNVAGNIAFIGNSSVGAATPTTILLQGQLQPYTAYSPSNDTVTNTVLTLPDANWQIIEAKGTAIRSVFSRNSYGDLNIGQNYTGYIGSIQINAGSASTSQVKFVTGSTGQYLSNFDNAGNLNVAGNAIINGGQLAVGNIIANSGTVSTSTTTGALIVQGGVGVSGNVYIGGITSHTGNVAFDGQQVTHYDSIIDLHTYGNLAAWSSDDGKDIGLRLHYYNGADSLAFVGLENSSKTLQFLINATEVAGNVTGTFGNAQMGSLLLSNTTASTSKTTGALQVAGGAGIAGDVNIGTSLTVDSGSYGNVTTTQFGSVFATAYGPNNYSILQAWSPATGGALGLNAYGNVIYSSGAITFRTGAAVRDKDYPTGGTTGVQIAANGAVIASTGITSTTTGTGAVIVTGGVGISGALNVGANVTVTGNVLPSANVTYSLGSATQRWKDLWLSGSTIDLSGATIKTDATTGAVAIIPNPTATNPNPSGIVISPAGTVSTVTTTAGVPTAGAISNVSNVATTSSTSTFANANVTSNTASTSTTTGALIVAGGTGIAGDAYIGGNVNIANRSYAKFSPTGSVYWIGLRSPSSVTANVIFNLPSADGTAGQFLKTDGAGNWSFAAGGSGGSSGFAVSTITTHPAASGDKRLGTGADNTTDETPFASGGTDAFGVSLGIVYDQMEPTGTTVTVEMGSAVSI